MVRAIPTNGTLRDNIWCADVLDGLKCTDVILNVSFDHSPDVAAEMFYTASNKALRPQFTKT